VVSFDNMSHEWTMKFIEHRVADRRILRLIQKWLKAGVSEDGQWSETTVGTPQHSSSTGARMECGWAVLEGDYEISAFD